MGLNKEIKATVNCGELGFAVLKSECKYAPFFVRRVKVISIRPEINQITYGCLDYDGDYTKIIFCTNVYSCCEAAVRKAEIKNYFFHERNSI